MGWLAFADPAQERQYQVKFALDQSGLDTAVSLQTLLFPSLVARTLWQQLGGIGSTVNIVDVLWLATFLAWAPLHLALAHNKPDTFLRWRTPLVLLSRLQRQLTILRLAALFNGEALAAADAAASAGVPASRASGMLGMLLWRPGSITSLLCTYALPLRYSAPCALALLAATLHSTLQQCAADCAGGAPTLRLYSAAVRQLRHWLLPWALQSHSGGGGSGSSEFCSATAAEGLLAGSGGGRTCSAHGCLPTCAAVHAWLQLVLGALLPLLAMWAVEERSRAQFQRRWLAVRVPGAGVTEAAPASSSSGGSSAGPAPAMRRPIPRIALAGWLVACAWTIWAVLDVLLLR